MDRAIISACWWSPVSATALASLVNARAWEDGSVMDRAMVLASVTRIATCWWSSVPASALCSRNIYCRLFGRVAVIGVARASSSSSAVGFTS
jgi:hypothetical protein